LLAASDEENPSKVNLFIEEGNGFILSVIPCCEDDVEYPVEQVNPWQYPGQE
jgi:hypothetical protein